MPLGMFISVELPTGAVRRRFIDGMSRFVKAKGLYFCITSYSRLVLFG